MLYVRNLDETNFTTECSRVQFNESLETGSVVIILRTVPETFTNIDTCIIIKLNRETRLPSV